MGCSGSVHSKRTSLSDEKKPVIAKIMFPLSMYQKSLLKYTWDEINKVAAVFGSRVFYKLLKEHPEMKPLFPEFSYLHDVEELARMDRLTGHPKKLVKTIRDAMTALDDADIFISYLQALGEKHVENSLRPEYLNALGAAFHDAIREILGDAEYNNDVKKAWIDFYNFICKLMKQGLAKRLALENQNDN